MLAGVLWGTTGTTQALSPYHGSSIGLGAARIAVAGLVLAGLALARHGRNALATAWRPGTRRTVVLGATCIAGYQACFFAATRTTGVVLGTLTAIGSAPLLAGALGLATGTRPTPRWAVGTALGVGGLVLLVTSGGGTVVRPIGVAAGLGAGAAYALYTWCGRRLLDAGVPDLPLLGVLFLGGTVVIAPFAWRSAATWFSTTGGAGTVAWLALVATVLPYLLWIRGMATTAPALATTLTLTEPLTATLLGVLVLDERLGPAGMGGAALVGLGLAVAVTARAETFSRPRP
jgi:DME family drug/metabolite transporter